ncbi:class I SAM-dependent methyltransferase [soil metagenome]
MTGELTVEEHYGSNPLRDRVNEALDLAGITADRMSWSDLAPVDQFHTRGLIATKELASALAIRAGASLLDVGSGIGGSARYLAATFGCKVTGIDLTPSFVDVATMLSERTNLAEETRFLQADALALPFDDVTFDYAWTQHVAMNIENRPQMYSEIYRVLKPSGKLGIHDIIAGNDEPLHFPVPWARIPEINFLLNEAEMRKELSRAGFQEVSWVDATDSTVAWFDAQRASVPSSGGAVPFGINILLGSEFQTMVANLERNFRERRVRIVMAVLTRD